VVISTIAPNDYDLQKTIIDACVTAKIRRFVPNEFGLDSQNHRIRDKLPAYDARARVIEYLRSPEIKDGRNLEWVAFATGTILDEDLLSGKVGIDLKWQSASLPCQDLNQSVSATSLARVGELVSSIFEHWESVKNSFIYAAGCMTSAQEIIDLLEKEMGVEFVVGIAATEDIEKEALKMVKGGWPDAGWNLLERSLLFDGDAGKAFLMNHGYEALGVGQEQVGDIVKSAVHKWRHTERGDCGCS
jgi:hypothetical protein